MKLSSHLAGSVLLASCAEQQAPQQALANAVPGKAPQIRDQIISELLQREA